MKITLHDAETTAAQTRADQEQAAPRLYDALRALSAETQGFNDMSGRTRALARAALANAEGRVDGVAEEMLRRLHADTVAYLAAHRAGAR